MNGKKRGFLHRHLWVAYVLVALLLPSDVLLADQGDECVSPLQAEPIALRDQRIPFYEVFETFLLHASFIYEERGPEAYRTFLEGYGLDPDLEMLRQLPGTFGDLEKSRRSDPLQARRLGEVFAALLDEIRKDPAATDDGRGFRFQLLDRLRPKISWVFLDEFPDFPTIDAAEKEFDQALGGAVVGAPFGGVPNVEGSPGTEPPAGVRVKMSVLGEWSGGSPEPNEDGSTARFEWRRYTRPDGSVRVIALIDREAAPPSLVDMSFPSAERLRPELRQAGIDGVLRLTEYYQVGEGFQEKISLGCLAAQATAAIVCAACAVPEPGSAIECPACAAAIFAMIEACFGEQCDQIQCNQSCVLACHRYGLCQGTGCQCYGIQFDTPGCQWEGPHPGCSTTVGEVSMLRLDGGQPVQLPAGAIALERLEESDVMHRGDPVSYLMGEWAVVELGTPDDATKAAPVVRTLRSSSPELSSSQMQSLLGSLPGAAAGAAAPEERLAVLVAIPPHEGNSREIPLPELKISSEDLPAGLGSGKVAIRADFAEDGTLQGFEILADTLGGVSPLLADRIEQALSLERLSEKEHRVVAFAVVSVGSSLEIESSLPYLPKCCCGDQFCV